MLMLQIAQCNEVLLRIQVPDTISRAPRSLLEFEKWKGKLHLWLLPLPKITERNTFRFPVAGMGAIFCTTCVDRKATYGESEALFSIDCIPTHPPC